MLQPRVDIKEEWKLPKGRGEKGRDRTNTNRLLQSGRVVVDARTTKSLCLATTAVQEDTIFLKPNCKNKEQVQELKPKTDHIYIKTNLGP